MASASPIPSRAGSTSRGRTAACWRPPNSPPASRPSAVAVSRSRGPDRDQIEEEVLPSLDLATGRPLDRSLEPDASASPTTTSWSSSRSSARRSCWPSRSRRCASPTVPGLCSSAASGLRRPARARGRVDRPAPRGPAGVQGRRRSGDRVDSALETSGGWCRGAGTKSRDGTTHGSATTSRSTRPPWVCPSDASRMRARASDAPPRAHPAAARGVSALPRAEAAASRVPELRLVRRPPGDRAQAGRRRSLRPDAVDGVAPAARARRPRRPHRGRRHGRRPRRRRRSSRARSTTPAPPADRCSSSATNPIVRARRNAATERLDRPRPQVIGMDEHPAMALREKKDASILVATELVKRGEADAVVTAGHTGAGMAAAVLRLGRLPGVDRPALAVQMVTDAGRSSCSTSGPTRTPRRRTSSSTRRWARSSRSGSWA